MKKIILPGLIIIIISAVFFAKLMFFQPPNTQLHGSAVKDYASLVNTLKEKGNVVTFQSEMSQPFFSVKGSTITVDGESIQVFEYASVSNAETEAQKVSSNGGSVGTSMMSWIKSPHFYKKAKLIVIYIGDNQKTKDLLTSVIGKQFAGK